MLKALLFDTFGTVVDWRGSIIEEGLASAISLNWPEFADRWRAGYVPSMDKVRRGELPWTNLDQLNRLILENLQREFQIDLSDQQKDHLNRVWHRLNPWPDAIPGLTRLKRKYVIAPLSNGNVALLTNMAKRAGLPWDLILSAELSQHYKPDPECYLTSVDLLGMKPGEVMMCAAHRADLDAARACGLRTGFIYRPLEFGKTRKADEAAPNDYDVVASDIIDLASKLS